MKKTLQTIGFLSLFLLSFEGHSATTEAETPEARAIRIFSSIADTNDNPGAKGLIIIKNHWNRFQEIFHGDPNALALMLETLVGSAPGKIIETAFRMQTAKNAEAAAKADAAAGTLGTRAGRKGVTDLAVATELAGDVETDLKTKNAAVSRLKLDIEAAKELLATLKAQEGAYKEASALVSNVPVWLSRHKDLNQTITDPLAAARAWVDRREGLNKISSTDNNQEKLALAQAVLDLVTEAPTADAMGAKTTERTTKISETEATIARLKEELTAANAALKAAQKTSGRAADIVASLTPPPSAGSGAGSPSMFGRMLSFGKKSGSGASTPTTAEAASGGAGSSN